MNNIPSGTPPGTTAPGIELTGTEPILVLLNTGSGNQDAVEVRATIEAVLGAASRRFSITTVEHPQQLPIMAKHLVQQAQREHCIVVAAGGDGTINAVTQAILGSGVAMGILPLGTFNYFSRAQGIPQDTEAGVRALLDARLASAQVGMLNNHVFLVNASLGLYPEILEDRETYTDRLGRSRAVALVAAIATLTRAHRQLTIQLEIEGNPTRLRTSSMVVANNDLQLEELGIEYNDELARGHLVAMTVKPIGTMALYGLLLQGLMHSLGEAQNLNCFGFRELRVRQGRRQYIKVALDGEVVRMQLPLRFKVAEQRLPLLIPRVSVLREAE